MQDEPHVHAQPRASEVAAAAAVAPTIATLKARILDALAYRALLGLTPDEFQRDHGGLINTVRRRFVDLWHGGRIKPTDVTRQNRAGNPETVWVLGRDEAMKPRTNTPALLREAVLTLLKRNGGPIGGFVKEAADRCDQPDKEVWKMDAYVMVRREDFDALEKLMKGGA